MNKSRLRIAIQKFGRLHEKSQRLLKYCGIKINLVQQRLLTISENMPIDILCVRDNDIPGLIIDGVVDLGIIGENVLEEEFLNRHVQGDDPNYIILRKLNFGVCNLSIAIPNNFDWDSTMVLQGKRIATSYPHILRKYLNKLNINFKLCLLNGSVEVAPRAGLSDVICDLVSTGTTIQNNGLYEVKIMHSYKACLVQRYDQLLFNKQHLIDKLLIRIQGIMQSYELKYIMMHVPTENINRVIYLLPGMEYPTIIRLAVNMNKFVLHMVSNESVFWNIFESLKKLNVSSILVLPIEKIME